MQAGRTEANLAGPFREGKMRQLRNCLALCAVLTTTGCAADFGDEQEPLDEEVGSVEQSIIVEWDVVCADPGTTIFYSHARVRGQNVGNSVAGGLCEFPVGCVTDYHVCDFNGCGPDFFLPWPGDDVCFNNV
jgi:hypothetical protein